MPRASGAISLLLMGSVTTVMAVEQSRRQSPFPADNSQYYPTTQSITERSSPGSHFFYYHGGYYYTNGGGIFHAVGPSGRTGVSSGITRGGFGSTGHALGGHA